MANQPDENPAMPEIRYFFSARIREPRTFWRSDSTRLISGTLTANQPIDTDVVRGLIRNERNVSDKADIIMLAFNTIP